MPAITRSHSTGEEVSLPENQIENPKQNAPVSNENSRVDGNSTSTSESSPADHTPSSAQNSSTLESMDTSPDANHDSSSSTSSTGPAAAKTASKNPSTTSTYPSPQNGSTINDTNNKMADPKSKKRSMADDLKVTYNYIATEGTLKEYQYIRQIGLNTDLKAHYNVRRNDGSYVGRTKIKVNHSDSNNPPSCDQITQCLADWNTDRQAESGDTSHLTFIPIEDRFSKGQFYLITPIAEDLGISPNDFSLQHKELVTSLTSNTYSYGDNLSFTVEEVQLTDATDIATFSLLIPTKSYFSLNRIIKMLFPEQHFTEVAIKKPSLPAMSRFGSYTKFFNVQLLMQVKRDDQRNLLISKTSMFPPSPECLFVVSADQQNTLPLNVH
ncbi:unnamed protein product [Ambrosiozyma monospora]|uniref:Unnamed protein product n=1 Tax=Ambrosiozyma monospora TaxID=43982 RepID=A0A9W6T9G4_AMBMO|nr:unnamed protein product [Ambrosiozyma monospora]